MSCVFIESDAGDVPHKRAGAIPLVAIDTHTLEIATDFWILLEAVKEGAVASGSRLIVVRDIGHLITVNLVVVKELHSVHTWDLLVNLDSCPAIRHLPPKLAVVVLGMDRLRSQATRGNKKTKPQTLNPKP